MRDKTTAGSVPAKTATPSKAAVPAKSAAAATTAAAARILEGELAKAHAELIEKDGFLTQLGHEIVAARASIAQLEAKLDKATKTSAPHSAKATAPDARVKAAPAAPALAEEKTLTRFDGSNGKRGNLVTGFEAPYSISARFRNLDDDDVDYSFSETSPPMPFVVGPIGLYRVDEETMRMLIGRGNQERVEFYAASDWVDLAITVGKSEIKVQIGGRQILACPTPFDSRLESVAVGCGHLRRGWSGEFEHFVITKGATSHDAKRRGALEVTEDTAFLYDGVDIVRK